jgi:hypothetical protein
MLGRRFRFESQLLSDVKAGSKARMRFHDAAKVIVPSTHER